MDIPLWKNRSIVEPGSILQLYRLKLGLVNYSYMDYCKITTNAESKIILFPLNIFYA